jgi:hypothetical protein
LRDHIKFGEVTRTIFGMCNHVERLINIIKF